VNEGEPANREAIVNSMGLFCLLFSRREDEKRVVSLMDRVCFEIFPSTMNLSKLAAIYVVLILWYTARILPTEIGTKNCECAAEWVK